LTDPVARALKFSPAQPKTTQGRLVGSDTMANGVWKHDFDELVTDVSTAVVRFWKDDVWPLVNAVSFFFLLALPLLLLLLVLWYLDAIGWRSESGFYKIGRLQSPAVTAMAEPLAVQPLPARPSLSIKALSDAKLSRANLV
jgi:hypothetical protein